MPTRVVNSGGTDGICRGDERFLMGGKVVYKNVEKKEEKGLVKNSWNQSISCSESSSIGKNSDLSVNSMEKSGDGEEVQSSFKGAFNSMEALHDVLPIRGGISRYYNGRSKSFTSLADTSSFSSSMKDLAKPENAYTRRRRSLLGCSLTWDKNRSSPLRSSIGGGISKRETSSSRTTLALAVAMNNTHIEKQAGEHI